MGEKPKPQRDTTSLPPGTIRKKDTEDSYRDPFGRVHDPFVITSRDRNVDQPNQYLPLLAKERVKNKFMEIQQSQLAQTAQGVLKPPNYAAIADHIT